MQELAYNLTSHAGLYMHEVIESLAHNSQSGFKLHPTSNVSSLMIKNLGFLSCTCE